MFPMNAVLEPMVAELATFQYTPAPEPVLITFTAEPDEVISELAIWKTQAALALPWPKSCHSYKLHVIQLTWTDLMVLRTYILKFHQLQQTPLEHH